MKSPHTLPTLPPFSSFAQSRVYEPEDLDLLSSVKSTVQLCAISRQVLYGSLVFDKLCVDKVDGP